MDTYQNECQALKRGIEKVFSDCRDEITAIINDFAQKLDEDLHEIMDLEREVMAQKYETKLAELGDDKSFPDIMSQKQAAKYLRLSVPTLKKYNVPTLTLEGSKIPRYRKSALKQWAQSQQVYGGKK